MEIVTTANFLQTAISSSLFVIEQICLVIKTCACKCLSFEIILFCLLDGYVLFAFVLLLTLKVPEILH